MKKSRWYDYLWIWTIVYFALGFFNILFAWLGMIDFLVPLFLAIIGGNKAFCNRYCGRGQLLGKCGKCSRNVNAPKWLSSKWFRYGFLVFFLSMFGNMIFQTYLVAAGAANAFVSSNVGSTLNLAFLPSALNLATASIAFISAPSQAKTSTSGLSE